jgi:uncharacterized DUF497 family protein
VAELLVSWDKKKNMANIKDHKIDFRDAALIFENPIVEDIDDRVDYGETRYKAIGLSGSKVLCVVYTWRGKDTIHIMSAWKANKYDKEKYNREIHA